jgi:hypothetical protein
VVVNDETAPVNIQGFVANLPPVRFQELISAVETGEGEACGAVVRIDGKRKVVEQVVIEAAPLQELTGPNVYLLVTGTGNLLRIETDLVRITDETPNGGRTRWGGRFEGPFLVGNEPQHNLAICARNGTEVRAFAIGIIEDLP